MNFAVRARQFAVTILLVFLAACAAVPQPQTLDQKLGYAQSTVTAVQDSVAKSLDANEISSAEAERILKVADDTMMFVVAAKSAMGAGDMTTAEGQLALTTNLLQQLLDYLRAKGK